MEGWDSVRCPVSTFYRPLKSSTSNLVLRTISSVNTRKTRVKGELWVPGKNDVGVIIK